MLPDLEVVNVALEGLVCEVLLPDDVFFGRQDIPGLFLELGREHAGAPGVLGAVEALQGAEGFFFEHVVPPEEDVLFSLRELDGVHPVFEFELGQVLAEQHSPFLQHRSADPNVIISGRLEDRGD